MNILSLGAGVQSTTMALMAARGEITPMPDVALFADTGWEPKKVYDHLSWLMSSNVLPFPVHIVDNGNIREDIDTVAAGEKIAGKGRVANAPFFAVGKDGKGVPIRRQCTEHYKVTPINRWIREKLGLLPRRRLPKEPVCDVWIGISLDEVHRMKPARDTWQSRRWPLIEARMTRNDCLRWMERNGYPLPPKSSCIGCPFHSDSEWRRVRESPDEWADAIEVDRIIRDDFGQSIKSQLFLHRSLVPLNKVDLSTLEDEGQTNMFGNECEGMCGV